MSKFTKKRPDRYTAIGVNVDELPSRIAAARMLGLAFFVESGRHGGVSMYVFFDDMGKQAYLSGAWDEDAEGGDK